MLNARYPDKSFQMFDRLLEKPGCLCKINTSHPHQIYTKLDRYRDYTGKALYLWKEGKGLHRTDIPNIFAPNTKTLIKALHHISLSIHFGIYMFIDLNVELHSPLAIKMMQQLVQSQSKQHKFLIFAGDSVEIPEELIKHFTVINHKAAKRVSYTKVPHSIAS